MFTAFVAAAVWHHCCWLEGKESPKTDIGASTIQDECDRKELRRIAKLSEFIASDIL
jgi:hypothetical protein